MPNQPARSLPTTAFAILGLLSFGDSLTGYQIKQRSEVSLRHFFWSPAMSQIYTEIKRLRKEGLVEESVVQVDDIRAKRVYTITGAGRAELARWLDNGPSELLVLKHLSCLRLFYGHLVEPGALAARMDDHARWADENSKELEATLSHLPDEAQWDYAAFVIEWGLDYYATEARSARRVADRLRRRAKGQRTRPSLRGLDGGASVASAD